MELEHDEPLTDRLLDLEAGDGLHYGLLEELEASDIDVRVDDHYHDSQGFIETWRIGDNAKIVVDSLRGQPMVRRTRGLVKELAHR